METQLVNELLQQDEGIGLEFKEEVNLSDKFVKADFLRHLLALANSAIGHAYLVVGIEDKTRKVVGLKDEHNFSEERVQQIVRQYCTPPIKFIFEVVLVNGLSVAVITIPESNTKPHWLIKDIEGRYPNNKVWKISKERVFIRRGSTTDEANPTEVIKLGLTANTLQQVVKITVNEILTSQYQESRRKKWRRLGSIDFGVISDNEKSREFFFYSLILAMYEVFGTEKYITFNGLLRLREESAGGQNVTVYELICPQIEFCEAVRREYVGFINKIMKQKSQGLEKRAAFSEIKKVSDNQFKFLKDWRVQGEIKYHPRGLPLEFICDYADKLMSIRTLTKLSPTPLDYPNKVTTTSEMLCYIASYSHLPFVLLDDFDFSVYGENYPLTKLFIDLTDRQEIDFGRFRINVNNYEEWDYLNPALDKEIRRNL